MTQTLWSEWVKLALLGTERQTRNPDYQALPAELQPLLKALYPPETPLSSATRESRYLSLAGSLSIWQSAGFKAELPNSTYPVVDESELPDAYLPEFAMRVFQQILKLENPRGLMAHWCQHVKAVGLPVKPTYLVEILEATKKFDELKEIAALLLGSRGQWLTQFQKSWQRTVESSPVNIDESNLLDEDSVWEDGNIGSRCAYLRALRAESADLAREKLQAVWKQENAKARILLMAELEIGISLADEEFLEHCLDDRAKGVRALAAELLARLPESAFAKRHKQRLLTWLSVKTAGGLLKRKRLIIDVDLPNEWDESWERDGIQKASSQTGKGNKAFWLEQTLSHIAVDHWSNYWQQAPTDILKAAKQSDWGKNLLTGWEASVQLQGCDTEWAEALLDHSGKGSMHPAWHYLDAKQAEQIRLAELKNSAKGKAFWAMLNELHIQLENNGHIGGSERFWAELLFILEQRIKRHDTPSHYTHSHALNYALTGVLGTELPGNLLDRYQTLLQTMIKDQKWEGHVPPAALEVVRLRLLMDKQFKEFTRDQE